VSRIANILGMALGSMVLATACGATTGGSESSAWLPAKAPTVEDCPAESRAGDYLPPESVLSVAEEWLIVREPSADIERLAETTPHEYVPVSVLASEIEGVNQLQPKERLVRLHGNDAPYVASALRAGNDVYMALFNWDGGEVRVAYTIIHEKGFSPYFAGRCATYSFAAPLRERLGVSYDEVVLGLVGQTDHRAIEASLLPSTDSIAPTPREVIGDNVETTDLVQVTIVISPPTESLDSQVLCSRLARGENECVSLGLLRQASRVSMSAWVGKGEPLSFDLTGPEGYPSVFEFGSVQPDMQRVLEFERQGGAILVVKLTGDPEASKQGSAEILDVLSATEVESDEKLRNRVYGYDFGQ